MYIKVIWLLNTNNPTVKLALLVVDNPLNNYLADENLSDVTQAQMLTDEAMFQSFIFTSSLSNEARP